jgi:hypothetical protein
MSVKLSGPLIILEFVGLQNFSLRQMYKKTDKTRWLRYSYSLLLTSLFVVLGVFFCTSSFFALGKGPMGRNILRFITLALVGAGLFVVVIMSLVKSLRTIQNEKKFFADRDKLIRFVGRKFGFAVLGSDGIIRSAYKKLIFIVILVLGTHGVALTQFTTTARKVECLAGMPLLFLLFLIVYKFTFYVEVLNQQLETVVELFGKLFERVPIRVIRIGHRPIPRLTGILDHPVEKLRAIRKIYNLIYENARIINVSNSLTIFLTLIFLVVSLVTTAHEWFFNAVVRELALSCYLETIYACAFAIILMVSLFCHCNRTAILVSVLFYLNSLS